MHELLWESMTPDPGPEPAWEVEVPGRGVMGPVDALVTTVRRVRGSGWAFLSWNPFTREIVAHVVPNHSYPAERFLRPLICVDAWEHAYYIDSPADREDYLDRIVNVLNWGTALKRFEA